MLNTLYYTLVQKHYNLLDETNFCLLSYYFGSSIYLNLLLKLSLDLKQYRFQYTCINLWSHIWSHIKQTYEEACSIQKTVLTNLR